VWARCRDGFNARRQQQQQAADFMSTANSALAIAQYEIRDFDGKHWEESYNASKIALLTARPE
jgi:hypothetical protein